VASDLVEQPQRTAHPGDPPPHRRRRDLPNRAAVIRLVGAVLAEQHDEWGERLRCLGLDVLARSRAVLTTTDPEEATHLAIASALSA